MDAPCSTGRKRIWWWWWWWSVGGRCLHWKLIFEFHIRNYKCLLKPTYFLWVQKLCSLLGWIGWCVTKRFDQCLVLKKKKSWFVILYFCWFANMYFGAYIWSQCFAVCTYVCKANIIPCIYIHCKLLDNSALYNNALISVTRTENACFRWQHRHEYLRASYVNILLVIMKKGEKNFNISRW